MLEVDCLRVCLLSRLQGCFLNKEELMRAMTEVKFCWSIWLAEKQGVYGMAVPRFINCRETIERHLKQVLMKTCHSISEDVPCVTSMFRDDTQNLSGGRTKSPSAPPRTTFSWIVKSSAGFIVCDV